MVSLGMHCILLESELEMYQIPSIGILQMNQYKNLLMKKIKIKKFKSLFKSKKEAFRNSKFRSH